MSNMKMPTISRPMAVAYLVVVLCLLVLGGRFLVGLARPSPGGPPTETFAALEAEPQSGQETGAVAPAQTAATAGPKLVVHVVGAVRRPGLYRLPDGSRVDDAIRRAGGATGKADLSLLNLAAPLADGQQVVVPRAGEPTPAAAAPATGANGLPSGPVHLNTATLEQLDALPGIGPVTAQKILDYREEHGGFRSVDELDAVPGIGPARLEQLREVVTL
jgi:competence protein ComEA